MAGFVYTSTINMKKYINKVMADMVYLLVILLLVFCIAVLMYNSLTIANEYFELGRKQGCYDLMNNSLFNVSK